MDRLKPCPKCNNKPIYVKTSSSPNSGYITCIICHTSTNIFEDDFKCDSFNPFGLTWKQKAKSQWEGDVLWID